MKKEQKNVNITPEIKAKMAEARAQAEIKFNKHQNTTRPDMLKGEISNFKNVTDLKSGNTKQDITTPIPEAKPLNAKEIFDESRMEAVKAAGLTDIQTPAEAVEYVQQAFALGVNTDTARTISNNYMGNVMKKVVFQYGVSRNGKKTGFFSKFANYQGPELTSGIGFEFVYHEPFGAMAPTHPQYDNNVPTGQDFKTQVFANLIQYNPNYNGNASTNDDFKAVLAHRAFETFEYFVDDAKTVNLVNSGIRDIRQVPLLVMYNRFVDKLRELLVNASTTDTSKVLKIKNVSSTFTDAFMDAQITIASKCDNTITGDLNINRSGKLNLTGLYVDDFYGLVTRTTLNRMLASKGALFNIKYSPGGELIGAESKDPNLLPFPELVVVDSKFYEPFTKTNVVKTVVTDGQIAFLHKTQCYKWGWALNKEAQQYFAMSDHTFLFIHLGPYHDFLQNGHMFLYENDGLLI